MATAGWTNTTPNQSRRRSYSHLPPLGARPPFRAGGADMTDMLEMRPSYSYQGQDLFVLDILGGLCGGYFLDSGASNGRKGSNTWLLESHNGWTGICVEPNQASFRQLKVNRACICLDCCLYDRDGPVE